MFASNQIFDVTCELDDLPQVIQLAMSLSGNEDLFTRQEGRVKPAFMIDQENGYWLGTGSMAPFRGDPKSAHGPQEHWTDFPFEYDPEIIALIISQWIQNQPAPEDSGTDGTQTLGVRVRAKSSVPPNFDYTGSKYWPCILLFQPWHVAYDK